MDAVSFSCLLEQGISLGVKSEEQCDFFFFQLGGALHANNYSVWSSFLHCVAPVTSSSVSRMLQLL